MATPPGMKLKRLCRTAVVPGARRVPLHEPIRLAEESSSARLALDPANTHASATSTPNAANPRIPRVHIFFLPPKPHKKSPAGSHPLPCPTNIYLNHMDCERIL